MVILLGLVVPAIGLAAICVAGDVEIAVLGLLLVTVVIVVVVVGGGGVLLLLLLLCC